MAAAMRICRYGLPGHDSTQSPALRGRSNCSFSGAVVLPGIKSFRVEPIFIHEYRKKISAWIAAALLLIRAAIPDEAPAPIPRSVSTPVAINYATLQLSAAGRHGPADPDADAYRDHQHQYESARSGFREQLGFHRLGWERATAGSRRVQGYGRQCRRRPSVSVGFKRRPLYAPLAITISGSTTGFTSS